MSFVPLLLLCFTLIPDNFSLTAFAGYGGISFVLEDMISTPPDVN